MSTLDFYDDAISIIKETHVLLKKQLEWDENLKKILAGICLGKLALT